MTLTDWGYRQLLQGDSGDVNINYQHLRHSLSIMGNEVTPLV